MTTDVSTNLTSNLFAMLRPSEIREVIYILYISISNDINNNNNDDDLLTEF